MHVHLSKLPMIQFRSSIIIIDELMYNTFLFYCNHVDRICVAVRRDNYPVDGTQMLPAHTISLLPPVTLTNLLPHELLYEVGPEKGRIAPGCCADLHNVNIKEHLEIVVQLDGYPGTGTVC